MKLNKNRRRLSSQVTFARAASALGAGALALGVLVLIPPTGGRSPVPLEAPAAEPALPGIDSSLAKVSGRSSPSLLEWQKERQGPSRLAVVVDDAGHNIADAEAYLRFPGKLTVAVLPHLDASEAVVARAKKAGKEVILHQPMEPQGSSDPGPGAIKVGLDEPAVVDLLEWNFGSVVTQGVNNHMGSRVTADRLTMDAVMSYLQRTNRFFLDSRTTPDSVAQEAAAHYGVPFLSRDVFLDVNVDEATVNAAIDRGLRIARRHGSAILIGHVTNRVVLSVLERRLREIEQAGFELVHLSELLPQ